MECLSCQEEVSEKFLHAIANNACPFCGQSIMPPELQALLNSLAGVMCDLETKGFLPEAEAWLKQNFNLFSSNSDEYITLANALAVAKEQLGTTANELADAKQKLDDIEKNP